MVSIIVIPLIFDVNSHYREAWTIIACSLAIAMLNSLKILQIILPVLSHLLA